MPKDTIFTASVDGISYSFRTLENYSAFDDGDGKYNFQDSLGERGLILEECSKWIRI